MKRINLLFLELITEIVSVYNSQFMVGSNYQFPQDTLNITYAAIGSKNTFYVNAGLYHFEIVGTVIIVNVPYFIVP